MKTFDFIVVGGGIIGMTTARELANRGARVAVFDQGQLGMESSWAAGGILSSMRPWLEHPASAELSEHGKCFYPGYVKTLLAETEIDPEYIRSGLVLINKEHAEKVSAWAQSGCIKVEKRSKISFGADLSGEAVFLSEIAQIRPSRLLSALKKSLEQLSVSIYEQTRINKLITKERKFQCVEFGGGKLNAGGVIVTTGAWSQTLLEEKTRGEILIKPVLGQMLCMKTDELFGPMVLDGGHYVIPRKDGHILIGSTMEEIGFNQKITGLAKKELLDWAYSTFPQLRRAKFVKQWAGLRPATAIGRPYIGRIDGYDNLYVNAGHFRKGILQAPSSAILIADYILGSTSFTDILNFDIGSKRPAELMKT